MTELAPSPPPPAFAEWLVELFAPAELAESVLGDLHEEFSDLTWKSGSASARRWYRRQSGKTVAHLASAGFRSAPWSLAGIVLVGLLLQRFSMTLPEDVIVAILRAQRPYSNLHYGFYVWLVTYGIPIASVIRRVLIGFVVPVLAKGRELVATVVLSTFIVLQAGWLLFLLFIRTAPQRPVVHSLRSFLLNQASSVTAAVLAGVIVRISRSRETSRLGVE